jgi:hypothetical protein
VSTQTPEYRCVFCGAPSWKHPADQEAPPDYCHESDHGEPEDDSISHGGKIVPLNDPNDGTVSTPSA